MKLLCDNVYLYTKRTELNRFEPCRHAVLKCVVLEDVCGMHASHNVDTSKCIFIDYGGTRTLTVVTGRGHYRWHGHAVAVSAILIKH